MWKLSGFRDTLVGAAPTTQAHAMHRAGGAVPLSLRSVRGISPEQNFQTGTGILGGKSPSKSSIPKTRKSVLQNAMGTKNKGKGGKLKIPTSQKSISLSGVPTYSGVMKPSSGKYKTANIGMQRGGVVGRGYGIGRRFGGGMRRPGVPLAAQGARRAMGGPAGPGMMNARPAIRGMATPRGSVASRAVASTAAGAGGMAPGGNY